MDLLHPIALPHPCRHRIDLLHHTVNLLALHIGQHCPMYRLHRMEPARIVHRTLELPLIQQRALTDQLAHTGSLHQGEHRLMQLRIARARPIPAPTTRLLLHLIVLHQLMKLRGQLLRIQLHPADQLQHMRQVYHMALLLLLLMEQVHYVDSPRLMGLAHQGQLLLTRPHHTYLPPLMGPVHRGQLPLTRQPHSDLLQLM